MAKIDITKTELVWPGKYNEDGTRKEVPRALRYRLVMGSLLDDFAKLCTLRKGGLDIR